MWWAAFAISHLLSIIGQTRLADHTIASVRFENLRELTPALNSIAEAKNLVPAAKSKPNADLRSADEPKTDALPSGTTRDQ